MNIITDEIEDIAELVKVRITRGRWPAVGCRRSVGPARRVRVSVRGGLGFRRTVAVSP